MSYDVHGIGVQVTVAPPAVRDALEHRLRRFRARARRDVRLEFTTSAPPAPPSGRPVYETPHGQLSYDEDGDLLFGELAGVHLRCAASEGVARLHAPTFAGFPLYLATHPLATVSLMELLERRERYSLHAACLARGGSGLLLAGPTGSGKSTLTLALLRAGLDFVSDDVVFLTADGGVLGFPDALGVTAGTAARFPELGGAAPAPAGGFPKRLIRVEDAFPAVALRERCEPRALVFPHVTPGLPSALRPLDPGEAWLRLVPDVLLTRPDSSSAHLKAIAALLERVGCYELASGADLATAAQLAADLLA